MDPTIITFVDDKMMPLAEEQAINFNHYGFNHQTMRLGPDVSYGTDLWIDLLDRTKEAIITHGKIMRLDAEVRMHRPLPDSWLAADNVLFEPYPIVKHPWYIAINTGHMILSESSIPFLDILKECILACIPPDGDTGLPASGHGHQIEDEWPSAIALRLSKINYVKERLCHDRRLGAGCAVNRGLWLEPQTVLTHPAIHNWSWYGAGLHLKANEITETMFVNHFAPQADLKKVIMIAELLIRQNGNANLWRSIGREISGGIYECDGWIFSPSEGKTAPINEGEGSMKTVTRGL